jgi:hypothetical protein
MSDEMGDVKIDQEMNAGWRTKLGFALFIISIGWPALLPIMPLVGLSTSTIAAFSGVMVVVAELMIVAGAAIAGKDGFTFIKSRVFGFLKSFAPPKRVSRARYFIGLVLFVIPLLLGWAAPYYGAYLPGFQAKPINYALAGDVLLLISLFVLGGDFWDKLRSLFIHDAYAAIPERSSTDGSAY